MSRNKPKSKINGWFDTELCSLQKEKRTTYLRFLRKNNPESQLAYHKIKNHYERLIKTKKSQYFQKLLASCQNDLKRTWSVINDIIGKKTSTSPNCLKHNGKLLTDPGAYLGWGGNCAMAPPFGSPRLQNYIEK